MGNSAGSYLQVRLNCDDASSEDDQLYVAGETVRGFAAVNIQKIQQKFLVGTELPSTNFRLVLQIVGRERCKVAQGSVTRKSERILLFNETILYEFIPQDVANWLPSWQDFSFSFKLPSQLPSSLRCDSPGRSYAELGYKVKALLEPVDIDEAITCNNNSLGGRIKSFKNNKTRVVMNRSSSSQLETYSAVQERPIKIKASPVPPTIVPFVIEPTIHEVKTFGLKSKGRVIFAVSVTDTRLGPGETLELVFACRNHSTVDVKKVFLKLVETVTWKVETAKHSKTVERTLSYQEEAMEVPAKPAEQIWYERNVESDINEFHDSFGPIYAQLQAKHNVFRIRMPDGVNAHDSYAGPLVRCTHHCVFTVKTPDQVDDPKVIVPLELKQFVPWDIYNAGSESFQGAFDANSGKKEVLGTDGSLVAPGDALSTTHLGVIQDEEEEKEDSDRIEPFRFKSFAGDESIPSRNMPTVQDVFGKADIASTRLGDNNEDCDISRRQSFIPVEVPLEQMIIGGRVRHFQEEASSSLSGGSWLNERDLSDLFQADPSSFPNFEKLLDEMLVSVDDLNIVQRKLEDPEWRPVLIHVSAEEFGLIIGHVNKEHDQPKVAVEIASAMFADSDSVVVFTCEHMVKAVEMAADWTRTTMVQNLLPFCCDFVESRKHLTEILTPWELTVLHSGT